MPERSFSRRDPELPLVDVPDWQLAGQLTALLREYVVPETSVFSITARDARGRYEADNVEEIQGEAQEREEPLTSLELKVQGGRYLYQVTLNNGWPSETYFAGPDEAPVAFLFDRTKELVERAAARRTSRLAAEEEAKREEVAPAAWRSRLRTVSLQVWLLIIAIAGTLIGALIWQVITRT
jgi:hypothetical protein